MRTIMPLVVALGVGCGGQPNVTGTLNVDGKPFQVETCFAGPTNGFFGTDIVSGTGARVRLVYHPSGKAIGYLFEAGSQVGIELGECGPMDLVNMHLAHAHGTATLTCTKNGHSLESHDLAFRDCEFVR